MDVRFDELFEQPENEIFRIVFFPDRIYHARYLSATRSSRYRYAVSEGRSGAVLAAMRGEVFFGGEPLCNMLRLEYSAQRLLELARERGRTLGPTLRAWWQRVTFEGAGEVRHAVGAGGGAAGEAARVNAITGGGAGVRRGDGGVRGAAAGQRARL